MPLGRNGARRHLETPHRIPPEPQPLHAPATEFTEPRATCLPPAQPRRALDDPVSRKHLGADALATRVAPTLLAFCPPLSSSTRRDSARVRRPCPALATRPLATPEERSVARLRSRGAHGVPAWRSSALHAVGGWPRARGAARL